MENNTDQTTIVASDDKMGKIAYKSPCLTEWGTLNDLTKGTSGAPIDADSDGSGPAL